MPEEHDVIPDPRNLGYSYGRALGVPDPESDAGKSYAIASTFSGELQRIMDHTSRIQWRVEMALRDVRLACAPEEQAKAIGRLRGMTFAATTEIADYNSKSLDSFITTKVP